MYKAHTIHQHVNLTTIKHTVSNKLLACSFQTMAVWYLIGITFMTVNAINVHASFWSLLNKTDSYMMWTKCGLNGMETIQVKRGQKCSCPSNRTTSLSKHVSLLHCLMCKMNSSSLKLNKSIQGFHMTQEQRLWQLKLIHKTTIWSWVFWIKGSSLLTIRCIPDKKEYIKQQTNPLLLKWHLKGFWS